jgi:hypothetical protein
MGCMGYIGCIRYIGYIECIGYIGFIEYIGCIGFECGKGGGVGLLFNTEIYRIGFLVVVMIYQCILFSFCM